MRLVKQRDIRRLEDAYRAPKTKENHIGLEIEFYSPYDRTQIVQLVYEYKLDKFVTVKGDSSLDGGGDSDFGHEINILMKEETFGKTLKKVCNLLKRAEAFVNEDCGLHVHIDMRNRDKDKTFYNLVYAQPLLYALNPEHRLDNGYSEPTTKSDFKKADRGRTGINAGSISKHGTIEIRIHEGSVSYKDIFNWINLLLRISQCRGSKKPESLKDCVSAYKLNAELARYINLKMRKNHNSQLINLDIDKPDDYYNY